ncbi:ABC transporter permease [Nakamurella sp. GG22]
MTLPGIDQHAGPALDLAAPGTSAHSAGSSHGQARTAVGLVLALTAGLSLVLALFVGVAVNSGPNGIRLAVAGPPAAVEQIRAGLTQSAGPDAFEVTVVADESAARSALADRSADGAIVLGANGPTLLTAGAGSPAVTQLLTSAAARMDGTPAAGPAVVDAVPLPSTDSRGVGLAAGSFPMIIAGLALGAASALALRNRWWVLGTAVGGAVAIGVSFAGVLAWLGVSAGNFVAEASAISLTVAASALVVAGLVRLVGPAGAGLGALLLVIIGNPLSGIATSPRLLPAPWGEFGQWLPTGAGGTLLRTAAYFPAASVWEPVLILLGWAALGAVGVIVGRRAGHSSPIAATA